MTSNAARIVLVALDEVEREWCWRDDWATGWDSIYALMSKFAKLNAITAREVASLFIDRDCGRRTAIIRTPDVDLRAIGPFDVGEISRILRLSTEQVRKAFVEETFPNSRRKVLPYLKWCEKCMREGFHAPIHQLEFLSACPLHGEQLASVCSRCKKAIPYRLTPDVFRTPYSCPHCTFDLAPLIRDPRTRGLPLSAEILNRLEAIHEVLAYEDEVLTLAFELDRQRWCKGYGRFMIQGADLRREQRDYAGFVSQVVETLRADSRDQMPLNFERVEVVQRTCWTPDIPRRKKRKAKPSTAPPLFGQQWDLKATPLYHLYCAIRRRLWRRTVKRHRNCCAQAVRALWWDIEGEQTANFCPVAEAFIRWRMYWEGERIPRRLYGGPIRWPTGIAKWYEESAPFVTFGWSPTGEEWLTEHVFASAIMGSFLDLAETAFSRHGRSSMIWNRREPSGRHGRYWAVTGNDTKLRPLILFQESGNHG